MIDLIMLTLILLALFISPFFWLFVALIVWALWMAID